jgi:hypothetical protein
LFSSNHRFTAVSTSSVLVAQREFLQFQALKQHLVGHRFKTDDNVEAVIKQWLKGQE